MRERGRIKGGRNLISGGGGGRDRDREDVRPARLLDQRVDHVDYLVREGGGELGGGGGADIESVFDSKKERDGEAGGWSERERDREREGGREKGSGTFVRHEYSISVQITLSTCGPTHEYFDP